MSPNSPDLTNFNFDKDQIIIYKLGVIESKLDSVLEAAADHEIRLKTLESGKAKVVGGLAVFTVGFNAIYTYLHSKGLV